MPSAALPTAQLPPSTAGPPDPRAIEEWKLLQAIIARQEDMVFRIHGYHYALVTAFSAAVIAAKIPIPAMGFFGVGVGLAVAFLWVELCQRVGLKRAIARSKDVEAALRDGGYDGPRLAEKLTEHVGWRVMFDGQWSNEMIWVPFIAMLLLVTILSLFIRHRGL